MSEDLIDCRAREGYGVLCGGTELLDNSARV